MPLKFIKRDDPVIVKIQMHQVPQVDRCQSCDFISLQVNFFQVRKSITGHQELDITQVVIFQVHLNYKFELLQVTDIPQLIEPQIHDSQMRIRVNGLGNLLQALVPEGELGVCEVRAVHGQRDVGQVLGDEALEGLVLDLLTTFEGDVLLQLVFRVLGHLHLLAGLGISLLGHWKVDKQEWFKCFIIRFLQLFLLLLL